MASEGSLQSLEQSTQGQSIGGSAWERYRRLVGLVGVAILQLPILAFIYDPLAINNTDVIWRNVRAVLREGVPCAVFFIAAVAILLYPTRQLVLSSWHGAVKTYTWRPWAVVNGIMFCVLIAATILFNRVGQGQADPPWVLFVLWVAAIGVLYGCLAFAMAPLQFWRATIAENKWVFAMAAFIAAFVQSAALLSRQSWNALSEATFQVSALILSLYEKDVIVEPARRILGVGDFKVDIAAACSGYEGIGLVIAFLSIYLWVFRSVLRFPNVFIIVPIGVAAIWVLNSVRIAALISLGAHVSPLIAVTGFHSQAGWMMFLAVTMAIMVLTHRLAFFHNRSASMIAAPPSPAFREAAYLLAPFLAMTAAGIIAAGFSGEGYWLYALRVAAIGFALVMGWKFYRRLDVSIKAEPLLLGLGVGIVWIVTDPAKGDGSPLGDWVAGLGASAAALWIGMRLIGTIVLVPIAEELAFRGYLHRKLIADKFETIKEGAFSWKAFLVSSILFGALHERWVAGALAGAVFAVALYRSGKIAGAIAAHMSANAVIAFWAIAVGQWSLL